MPQRGQSTRRMAQTNRVGRPSTVDNTVTLDANYDMAQTNRVGRPSTSTNSKWRVFKRL